MPRGRPRAAPVDEEDNRNNNREDRPDNRAENPAPGSGGQQAGLDSVVVMHPDEADEAYLAKASPVGQPIDPKRTRNPDPENPIEGIIPGPGPTVYEGNFYLPAQRALPEDAAPEFAPHVNVNRPYGSEPMNQEEGTGVILGRTKPLSDEPMNPSAAVGAQQSAANARIEPQQR